jgi:hypothetical protein
MNNELLKEAAEVVDFLNEEWYDQTKDDECLPFELIYFTHCMGIKFMDQLMWDDQDYDREYIDDNDTYEPILTCVIRRTNKFLTLLRGFSLDEK